MNVSGFTSYNHPCFSCVYGVFSVPLPWGLFSKTYSGCESSVWTLVLWITKNGFPSFVITFSAGRERAGALRTGTSSISLVFVTLKPQCAACLAGFNHHQYCWKEMCLSFLFCQDRSTAMPAYHRFAIDVFFLTSTKFNSFWWHHFISGSGNGLVQDGKVAEAKQFRRKRETHLKLLQYLPSRT